jgi:ATP-binding cassette subfamily B protein
MTRILKYIKPFWIFVLAAFLLLSVQAYSDLALPDYMSRIVNVGIQQGGVQNAVPVAVRQSEMNKLVLFMSPADRTGVLNDYTLVTQSSPNYATSLKSYPALANEPVYVLNNLDSAEISRLNPIIGKALLAVSGIQQAAANPAQASQMAQSLGIDLSKLPPGTDPFAALAQMPPAQLAQITAAIDKQFATLGESTIVQMAAPAVKAEYTALGMNTTTLQNNYLLSTGGIMLLLSLLSAACAVAVGYAAARTAAGLGRDLRKNIFRKVQNFSGTEFASFSTASLITRSTNDVTQIQMFIVMMIRMVFYAPIIGVGGVIRALSKDTSMWWILALVVGVLLVLIGVIYLVAVPRFKVVQKLVDRLNLVARENLSGMMVIRAFDRQGFEENRFDSANRDLTQNTLFINRVMMIMMPVMMLLMNGMSALIIWIGAHQIALASMQVGDMIAFMQYAMQIVFSFLMLSMMFIILPRAEVSADRIADVLETEPVIVDPERPKHFHELLDATVEFRQASFRYPGAEEDVLHDIEFAARPGQTTAIVGTTGSGKSTVVSLIPRFYDVTGGVILIDGVDIRQVSQHDLRERIGYVSQKSTLFSGTVAENLRYGNENATDEELIRALEIAQAADFVLSMPDGLDTEVSESGTNLSGGQKQRLAIARALVKKSPIYVFDDSFSALDFKTEAALRRALRENLADSNVIMVTQRVASVKEADQIIVLDEGRVVALGTHAELMATSETYREIATSQLTIEELA